MTQSNLCKSLQLIKLDKLLKVLHNMCMKKILALFLLLNFTVLQVLAADAVIFKSSGGYGLKSANGKVLLQPVYQEVVRLSYTPAKKFIVPMHAMDEVQAKQLDLYRVKKNNLYGVADDDGKLDVPCKYTKIEVTDNGELKLYTKDEVKYANPVKNVMKNTKDTMVTVIALPVTIVGAVMMPIEAISKMGRK